MSKPRLSLDYLLAAVVLAVSIFAGSAMLVPYQLHGHSSLIDLQRQISLDAGIRAGVWYPRWAPFTYFGYGSPLFNFCAPLAYYIAEVPVLAGASIMNGLKTAYLLAVLAAGLSMFLFGRELGGRWAGLASGCLYVLSPYLLSNLYVRAALSELTVFWEAALLLYALLVYRRTGKPVWLAASSGLFGILVLTHNISALIYAAVIPAFCLVALEGRRRWLSFITVPGGLLISAFFWLPAFFQRNCVQAEQSLTSGYYSYGSHFLYPMQLIVHRWGFGSSNPGPGDDLPLMIGLVHLAGIAIFFVGWKLARGNKREHWALLALLTAAAFLTLPYSEFLWRRLSLLRFVQFPWRFLGVVALTSCALSAAGISLIAHRYGNRAAAAIATSLIVVALVVYGPHVEGRFALYERQIGKMHLMKLEMVRPSIDSGNYIEVQDLVRSPEFIVQAGGNATSGDDYLPWLVKAKPQSPPPVRFRVLDGDASLSTEETVYDRHRVTASSRQGARLVCEVFDFPGWSVAVDGEPVLSEPLAGAGTLSFPVPPGIHAINVRYSGTALQKSLGWISGLGWITLIGLVVWYKRREPDSKVPMITAKRSSAVKAKFTADQKQPSVQKKKRKKKK
jgi:hypothetical protein